jgi:hypothetical protein
VKEWVVIHKINALYGEDHLESGILILLVQFLESGELARESAVARGVDDQQRMTGEGLAQVHDLA